MKLRNPLALVLMALLPTALQAAPLKVVATTTSMEALVREVAGDAVQLSTLAPPDRDAHVLQVKPSMMRTLRDANLVVAVGAELEQGWLPLAISSSANPRIIPGSEGYFEAAAQVSLIDAATADRSHGDVHPAGNPHIQMDPERMAKAGTALAERLSRMDSTNAPRYRERARHFAEQVASSMTIWRQQTGGHPGVVLYHKDSTYLMRALGVPVLAYVEPVPGIPPTASHLLGLTQKLRGKKGIILHTTYQTNAGIRSLADSLGWKSVALPIDPPSGSDGTAHLRLIGQWVSALQQGR